MRIKKMSVWDNTVRASNLFTYKNLSEERVGGEKNWKCKRDKTGRDFHLYTEEADNSFIEYRLCE